MDVRITWMQFNTKFNLAAEKGQKFWQFMHNETHKMILSLIIVTKNITNDDDRRNGVEAPTHQLIYCQVEFYRFESKTKQMALQ